jgi:AcrR family transcriptional regulator
VTPPAHRPSRRADIVDAAIRLFARRGFVDTSIADVADESDVVVTAVYYHFSGKEELFTAAVNRVFEQINEVVEAARPEGGDGTLDDVIDAVWDWIDEHPDEAALVHLQLPGVTRQTTTMRQDFDDLHVRRAFGYIGDGDAARARVSPARVAAETLSARTLVDMLVAIHPMRMVDGPLSGESSANVRKAVHRLSRRILALD